MFYELLYQDCHLMEITDHWHLLGNCLPAGNWTGKTGKDGWPQVNDWYLSWKSWSRLGTEQFQEGMDNIKHNMSTMKI